MDQKICSHQGIHLLVGGWQVKWPEKQIPQTGTKNKTTDKAQTNVWRSKLFGDMFFYWQWLLLEMICKFGDMIIIGNDKEFLLINLRWNGSFLDRRSENVIGWMLDRWMGFINNLAALSLPHVLSWPNLPIPQFYQFQNRRL